MKRLLLVLFLLFPASVSGASLPDFTITSGSGYTVPPLTEFTHTFTVYNIGGTAGRFEVTDSFTTNFDVISTSPACHVHTTLVRSVRRQVGVVCSGTLNPGESITLYETLRSKYLSAGTAVMVNRNHNYQLESNYNNNSAPWNVVVVYP